MPVITDHLNQVRDKYKPTNPFAKDFGEWVSK
jgi:hypothetical protein